MLKIKRLSQLQTKTLIKLVCMTTLGVAICTIIAIGFTSVLFWRESGDAFRKAMTAAILLPIVLATPLFIFASLKLLQISQLNRALRIAASHDGMTGLLNRQAFYDRADEMIQETPGASGCVLLLIDADLFKNINDNYGHATGDEALRLIAKALKRAAGEHAIVGRLGGEEFAVLLPDADVQQGIKCGEAICSAVRSTAMVSSAGGPVKVSVSVGGASSHDAHDLHAMLRDADERLYLAKSRGRGRVEFFSEQPSGKLMMCGRGGEFGS